MAIWKIVRSQPDAEDLVQETFLQIYRSLPQFRNSQAVGLRTWMMRIATRKAIDWTRMQRTALSLAPQPDLGLKQVTELSAEAQLLRREEKQELHALLRRLPDDYREAVELFYFQDKSYQEIAEAQQVAVKTVESRLYRAKRLLRQSGKEEGS
jgi:RNA polymerase sigma factor (sigma-70 family)